LQVQNNVSTVRTFLDSSSKSKKKDSISVIFINIIKIWIKKLDQT
jgi:hypothetical protein